MHNMDTLTELNRLKNIKVLSKFDFFSKPFSPTIDKICMTWSYDIHHRLLLLYLILLNFGTSLEDMLRYIKVLTEIKSIEKY